ncbi:MAG: purine-nucleoside phosphorylase [Erysipelotrichaceae bacterium]
MSTPHNRALDNEIAKTVLMPGDPLRAKMIAEKFLTDVKMFNDVRGMYGFTGNYKGKEVSVMGSGMGMPSIGIYSYELFKFYNVENIIRIGSAGAYDPNLNVFDVVLANCAYSESSYALTQNGYDKDATYPSDHINEVIVGCASELGINLKVDQIHSSDVFYRDSNLGWKYFFEDKKCCCVEMESFALFHNAKVLNKNAACLLTISDSLVTHQESSADERQNNLLQMIEIALESAIKL